jgi:hypothetical protein
MIFKDYLGPDAITLTLLVLSIATLAPGLIIGTIGAFFGNFWMPFTAASLIGFLIGCGFLWLLNDLHFK